MTALETKARKVVNGQIKLTVAQNKKLQTKLIENGFTTLAWMVASAN